MKVTPKAVEMAVILITVVVMLAPLTGFADTPDTAIAAQATVESNKQTGDEIGKAIGDAMGSMDMGHAILVPILGIFGGLIMPLLMVIVIVFLIYRHRERKEQRNHETIRLMIEKGIEIPPNLSFGDTAETVSPLNRGLKFLGIGVGLVVFFLVMGMTEVAGVGAIPMFIGLAYLLIWHLEKKQKSSAG